MRSPDSEGGASTHWIRSNILGLVAIFIALGGSAVAAQVAADGGAETAKKKKKKAKTGPRGPAGPPGSALAFAHVAGNGTLDAANSRNISTSVKLGGNPGLYCVTPGVPVRNVVVSVDSQIGGRHANASFNDDLVGDSCPGGAVVSTYVLSSGASQAEPFYIVFN